MFDQPITMLRSNANPELWGLSLKLPLDIQLFQYRYIVYDSEGLPCYDSGHVRSIDVTFQLASTGSVDEISVDDTITQIMRIRG